MHSLGAELVLFSTEPPGPRAQGRGPEGIISSCVAPGVGRVLSKHRFGAFDLSGREDRPPVDCPYPSQRSGDSNTMVEGPADIVLEDARVYTGDAAHPRASVVAISGAEIAYVGEQGDSSWRRLVGPDTNVAGVQGRTIIPGLIDSHTHPDLVALSSWHISLPRTDDLRVIQDFLRRYATEHSVSDVPFIYAEYYPSEMDWGPDGPTAAAIDAAVSDRPVLLQDFSDHGSTVNSRMLELLGVDAQTPIQIDPNDPAPRFVRGSDGVTPTGLVRERAWTRFADTMYDAIGWRPPEESTPEMIEGFTSFLSSKGVVALLDAATSRDAIAAAAALDEQGKLN